MNKQIKNLINSAAASDQPTLSAFVNLQSEDHSFKKLKSLFTKAKNELQKQGSKIDKLNELLADNLVSGNELNLDTGLSDVNVAIYITKDRVFSIHCARSFNDQYCLNQFPFIIPLIQTNANGIKALVMMRKFTRLYSFDNDNLARIEKDFPVLNEYDLENFDNQVLQDRGKKRDHAIFKAHIKDTLDVAAKECFANDDRVLIVAKEDFLRPVRDYMESSAWKRSHVVEKHNFQHPDDRIIEKKIHDLVEKNKMNHYKSKQDNRSRDFRSLNTIKKDVGLYNIKNFWLKDALAESTLADIPESQDLNQFLISLIESDIQVSSYQNLENNFSVDLINLDDGQYGQI